MAGAAKQIPPAICDGAEIAFVCDERGAIVDASEPIGRMLGHSRDSMRGRPLAELALDEDAPAVRRGLDLARESGSSSFSARLCARDGAPIEESITAWSVEAAGSRLTLCLAAASEEERCRAEERARCFADTQTAIATILALALEEIPLVDLLERTLDLILSVPWLRIEQKGAIFLVEQEPRALVLRVHRGLATSLVSCCSHVPFGTCLCGEAAARRVPQFADRLDDRHSTRYAGIVPHGHYCVPICTEEETLGVINTYLAPGHERSAIELEFLTAVANTLAGVLVRRRADARRTRAEKASRAKSDFLALVSHELLTPVTAVLLSCERLERDRTRPPSPRQSEVLRRMEGALVRLASTIRMLLEHARLDGSGPPVRRDEVDLVELAARVVEEVRPLALRKGLDVRLVVEEPLPVLRSDGRLLGIVLANLASNAVKFTKKGWVAVKVGYRDGAHRVAIEDTGPGIAAADRSRMFEPFETLEPLANKHVPGMGLGLALAHRLAGAMGARLELEARTGPGSTFVVTLPGSPDGNAGLALN